MSSCRGGASGSVGSLWDGDWDEKWVLLELALTSLCMNRPSGQLPSQPRDGQEVVLVYGEV